MCMNLNFANKIGDYNILQQYGTMINAYLCMYVSINILVLLACFLASLVNFVSKLENKMKFNIYLHIYIYKYCAYIQIYKQNWTKRVRNACLNNDLLEVLRYGTILYMYCILLIRIYYFSNTF